MMFNYETIILCNLNWIYLLFGYVLRNVFWKIGMFYNLFLKRNNKNSWHLNATTFFRNLFEFLLYILFRFVVILYFSRLWFFSAYIVRFTTIDFNKIENSCRTSVAVVYSFFNSSMSNVLQIAHYISTNIFLQHLVIVFKVSYSLF